MWHPLIEINTVSGAPALAVITSQRLIQEVVFFLLAFASEPLIWLYDLSLRVIGVVSPEFLL